MAAILNTALVKQAVAMVQPAIEMTLATCMPDRVGFALVVSATRQINPWCDRDGRTFRASCYLVTTIGDISRSPYPNTEIALKKAEASVRSGLPTAHLPPHYLNDGDTVYWGSAVLDGIVVACAGLEPRYDEMFSYWIASAVQAEAKRAFADYLAVNPDISFLKSG